MSLADKKQINQRFRISLKHTHTQIKGITTMQTQHIWPIPNDDEWPLATVFDVTAKSALPHHNDGVSIS